MNLFRKAVNNLFEPLSVSMTLPAAGSTHSVSTRESALEQQATYRIGGNVYVNWIMQRATSDERPKRFGIAADTI